MKVYNVEFNEYLDDGLKILNRKQGSKPNCNHIDRIYNLNNNYNLLVKESDLEYFRQFGDGFKKIELIGELIESPKVIRIDEDGITFSNKEELVCCLNGLKKMKSLL